MNIGALLKYYRLKANKTQNEVSQGICSVSHYSKIEKNSKEVNKETLDLIFNRLGIQMVDIESKKDNIASLLERLLNEIIYRQKEEAANTFLELEEYVDLITFTEYLYTYELYKFRYYLFIREFEQAKQQKNFLTKHQKNFNQFELNLYYSFLITYHANLENFDLAEEIISKIIVNGKSIVNLGGDEYYAIGYVKSKTNIVEGIIYYRKALTIFSNEYNQKRVLHCLIVLGNLYTKLKVFDEARNLYLHALRLAKEMKLDETILKIGANLSLVYIQNREFEKARKQLEKYSEKFDLHKEEHYVYLFTLGFIYSQLNNKDIAKKYFYKVKKNIPHSSKYKAYRMFANLYLLLISEKDDELMTYYEDKIIPILSTIDVIYMEIIKNQIKDVYIKNGQYKKAVLLF